MVAVQASAGRRGGAVHLPNLFFVRRQQRQCSALWSPARKKKGPGEKQGLITGGNAAQPQPSPRPPRNACLRIFACALL